MFSVTAWRCWFGSGLLLDVKPRAALPQVQHGRDVVDYAQIES